MKKLKKLIVIGVAVFALAGLSLTALAASQYSTKAEAVAGLTDSDVQSVIERRAQTGETFGAMAKDAGVLEKFREETKEMLKDKLEGRVKDGSLTQEQADEIMERFDENRANCDGNGVGQQKHANLGMGAGHGRRNNQGKGQGAGQNNFGICNGQGAKGRMGK